MGIEKEIIPASQRRLDPIDSIVGIAGLSYKELAVRLGVTRETVFAWRRNDDMKFSRMAEIADLCGFTLRVGMCRGKTPVDELIIPIKKEKPLRFVSNAFSYYRYSQKDVIAKTKMPAGTLHGWLYLEKCTLKDIMLLASAMGLTLHVVFEMKPKSEPIIEDPAILYSSVIVNEKFTFKQ